MIRWLLGEIKGAVGGMCTSEKHGKNEGIDLHKMAIQAVTSKDDQDRAKWLEGVVKASPEELISLVSKLTSEEDYKPAKIKTLREAVICEIERKNSQSIINTMETLDRSATWLTWVTIGLTVVGLILVGVQIWQAK
jgi:hypothetical protein